MEMQISHWNERSGDMGKFAPAFIKLQSELEPVKKDAANPFFKSKYAELSSILEAVQPLLTKHSFCLIQEPGNHAEKLALTTTLMHVSGEYIRSTVAFPVVKQDPQGYGSTITYARRYALQSIIGLPVTDDDGNHGSGNVKQQPRPYVTPGPPKKAEPTQWDGSALIKLNNKNMPWKVVPADTLEKLRHQENKDLSRLAELEVSRREEEAYNLENGGN